MKHILFSLIVIFSIAGLLHAQGDETDPLTESRSIRHGAGQEVAHIGSGWNQQDGSFLEISLYKYFKEMEYMPQDTLAKVLNWKTTSSLNWATFYDFITADLDLDGLQEIAAVWLDNDKNIELVVLKPNADFLGIDSLARWDKIQRQTIIDPRIIDPGIWFLPNVSFIQAGNFDSDSLMELVIAYWISPSGSDRELVQMSVFDLNDSLKISHKGDVTPGMEVLNEPLMVELCEDATFIFDIESGDFDGDGIDEILLAGRQDGVPDNAWNIFANIYAYDDQIKNLAPKSKNIVYEQSKSHFDIWSFNLVVDHIMSEDKEDAVLGFMQYSPPVYEMPDSPADTVSYLLIPVDVSDELDTVKVGNALVQYDKIIPSDCYYNRTGMLEAKDVNNDDLAEIFSAFSFDNGKWYQGFKIYQADELFKLTEWANLDNLVEELYADIAIGDVIYDTLDTNSAMELIITSRSGYQSNASLYRLVTDESGNFVNTEFIHAGPEFNFAKTENIQIGDFDGDVRLGLPRRFTATKILQPLVILNAPPVHFDIFDDVEYDLCYSYNGNIGKFVSSYIKEVSQETEMETEVNMDWSLSWTASSGFSFWGVSVSSHLSETYGKRFSKVANTSTKVTVSDHVTAIQDDRIYAMVMDYNIWEYPVSVNNELMGHVLVVEPLIAEYRWFPSNSWSGYDYIPNHEVGNILSYREYPLLSDNPFVDEKIKGDVNKGYTLDGTPAGDWSLLFEDFESNEVTTAKEFSRDWGFSVSGWGSGFSLNGSYNREDIQTQRTAVSSGLELDVHLDAIDLSLGEVGYNVIPYAYWANNGALVIDYAVKPELAAPGGTKTWWQKHYGDHPDPAFILPWRYYPEKGFTIEEEAKRFQTKDLAFYPANPREGDVIKIEARLHNFSLIPTASPIGVKFYVGDPDSGGTLIESVDNKTEIFTDEAIPARGTKVVQMNWEVPTGIGTFPRIYSIIDQPNTITEIHENNNKSWNILQKSTATAITREENGQLPDKFALRQNYPNPFNPSTIIEFSLQSPSYVDLEVFNTLGERVDIIESKHLPAGKHAYNYDGRMLPSGLYFYRIKAGNFHDVKKMILIK